MKDFTFIFTVGGDKHHYTNMFRCMRSFERLSFKPKCLVLEFGNQLKTCDDYEVISYPKLIDFNSGKKVGYIIWRHKYEGALQVKTKYGAYIDTDTVIAQDNFKYLVSQLKGGIAVTKHFWVPSIGAYREKAVSGNNVMDFEHARDMLNLSYEDSFYAGGFFLFENCSMGDEHMPMMLYDSLLYGKNSYELFWTKVTVLHCDVERRDPSEKYEGCLKEEIKKAFYI